MKFLKGNQVIIYVIALMLVAAGYLNYTTNNSKTTQTSSTTNNVAEIADIGDAALVNSDDVVTESAGENTNTTTVANATETNTVNTSNTTETNNATTEQNTAASPSDYFATSKIERDKMYSQMLEVYQNVLNSTSSQEAQKQAATEEIQKINNTKNSIMICENLIKTKGFDNSVIFVNGESINVIIGTTELTKEQVTQLQEIIQRELKSEPKNIHISIK